MAISKAVNCRLFYTAVPGKISLSYALESWVQLLFHESYSLNLSTTQYMFTLTRAEGGSASLRLRGAPDAIRPPKGGRGRGARPRRRLRSTTRRRAGRGGTEGTPHPID